jgi:hypothetical protein
MASSAARRQEKAMRESGMSMATIVGFAPAIAWAASIKVLTFGAVPVKLPCRQSTRSPEAHLENA